MMGLALLLSTFVTLDPLIPTLASNLVVGSMGIGTATPHSALEVNGGIQLNTATSRPACAASLRGTMWVVESANGVTDNAAVCLKSAADTYSWIQIVTGG